MSKALEGNVVHKGSDKKIGNFGPGKPQPQCSEIVELPGGKK